MINHISKAKLSTTQMSTMLGVTFERRAFTPVLHHRMRKKYVISRALIFRDGLYDLLELFKKTQEVKKEGGMFEIVANSSDFSIKFLHVQFKLMRDYACMYLDLILNGGALSY